jgi:multicomponent Na+:H+ antiporter subunit E
MNVLIALLLAVTWAALTGSFAALNLGLGVLLGFGVLAAFGHGRRARADRRSSPLRRAVAGVSLAAFAAFELVLANLRVARHTLSDLRALRPAILAVPLRPDLTDGEITLLAALITLTPGTLTLDLADDRRALFVHFMHVDDPARAIRSITEGFERRILEFTR